MGQNKLTGSLLPMHKCIVKFVDEIVNEFGQMKKRKTDSDMKLFPIKSSLYTYIIYLIHYLYIFSIYLHG